MSDSLDSPERTRGDTGHAVVKAAIGSVPIVGAAGAELFAYVGQEPYEKRREQWMRDVGDAIGDLRDRSGLDVEALRSDPAFTDTVLQATQAALASQEEATRRALMNAVLNSALPFAPDAAVRHTFIRLIREFTPWHLRLLDLFDDPVKWQKVHGKEIPELYAGGPSHVVEHAYPELRSRRDLYDQWWRDLHARGLTTIDQLHTMMTGQGIHESRTTGLGKAFLKFIREPGAA